MFISVGDEKKGNVADLCNGHDCHHHGNNTCAVIDFAIYFQDIRAYSSSYI